MPKTEAQLERMAKAFKGEIIGQLRRKRKRVGLSIKWTKDGKEWTPVSVKKRSYTSNYKATGNLIESVEVVGGGLQWTVEMDDYAKYLISGRKPGKGIPPSILQKWIKDKGIKARTNGKFAKTNKHTYTTMGFLMNRKIKYFGIEGYDFVTPAKNDVMKRFKGSLTKATGIDIKNIIKGK